MRLCRTSHAVGAADYRAVRRPDFCVAWLRARTSRSWGCAPQRAHARPADNSRLVRMHNRARKIGFIK